MPTLSNLRPSTIDGIKRLAARLRVEQNISHTVALDRASVQAGFHNYVHARRMLGGAPQSAPAARSRRDEYRAERRSEWIATIDAAAGPSLPFSTSWTRFDDIMAMLHPFMGPEKNHGYFPTGGGNDFTAVRRSIEDRCLELAVGSLTYIARPRKLRLERIDAEVAESFLYLELDELERADLLPMLDELDDASDRIGSRRQRESEELCDLGDLNYWPREVYDRGFIEHEDDPLPPHARRIHRLLRGNMMFVCKASIWNGIPQTYNGMHDQLGADGVRDAIERGMARRTAKA